MKKTPSHKTIAPFGTWKSFFDANQVSGSLVKYRELHGDANRLFWSEGRPEEGGRQVIVQRKASGETIDWIPAPYNARSMVHEYGGGAFTLGPDALYFVNKSDQRIYRSTQPGKEPVAVSADIGDIRYADLVVDSKHQRLIAVSEDHRKSSQNAEAALVVFDLTQTSSPQEPRVLHKGHDFYASPALSPESSQLAFLTWEHPSMPWDENELWLTDWDGDTLSKSERRIAGGNRQSVFQPRWSPNGTLYFISDPHGWWNLHRLEGEKISALLPMEAEFGQPQWVFGQSTYDFVDDETLVATYLKNALSHWGSLDLKTGEWKEAKSSLTEIALLKSIGGDVVIFGSSPTDPPNVWKAKVGNEFEPLNPPALDIPAEEISVGVTIEFPVSENSQEIAHGFYYPPTNARFEAPEGEKPPLLVLSHGGPTGNTSLCFSLGIQYWTNRGFAVVDVNYRGSTGFGREYREKLYGKWGVVDVEDCVAAARWLSQQGKADENRCAIRGGSAGGYTTLCALTFQDFFKAGASHYGVSDILALMGDTHKFESKYDHHLVGDDLSVIRERSPIHYVDQLNCPVIFFQGTEDKVVPPNQAEVMVESLKERGVPVAYVLFEGEGHGFRKSENIKTALESELVFYGKVFNFDPSGNLPDINLIGSKS